MQDTDKKRMDAWCKGHKRGVPDLIIQGVGPTRGIALEVKNPMKVALPNPEQVEWLKTLGRLWYETMVSNCYDDIVYRLSDYQRKCVAHKKMLAEMRDQPYVHIISNVDLACTRSDGQVLLCKYNSGVPDEQNAGHNVAYADEPWEPSTAMMQFGFQPQNKKRKKDATCT